MLVSLPLSLIDWLFCIGKIGGISLQKCVSGHEVVIIKDGTRACGSGGVLGNAPLVQSKSYFEVKLQQSGTWS